MPARLDSVCKYICQKGDWKVSNLQLQKVLYLAEMYYLGKTGKRLSDAQFQAWDYGPVEPSVYRQVRMFGSDPIQDVFYGARPFKEDDPRKIALDEVCEQLLPLSAGTLVDITHSEKGAWFKHYVPGCRAIPIPESDIAAEYRARTAPRT